MNSMLTKVKEHQFWNGRSETVNGLGRGLGDSDNSLCGPSCDDKAP